MYIPKHFQISDQHEAIEFIKRFSFGMLVSVEDGKPIATHIPFVVAEQDGRIKLSSHIALANPQHITFGAGKVLTVFTEPHAYISPSHYEKELVVPTWNYIAVHAYGNVHVIKNIEDKLAMLKDMITFYNDTDYLSKWDTIPLDYKTKMANGIVAFDILVDDLQGQMKLSQNKTDLEKTRIIDTLSKSDDSGQQQIAVYMRKRS